MEEDEFSRAATASLHPLSGRPVWLGDLQPARKTLHYGVNRLEFFIWDAYHTNDAESSTRVTDSALCRACMGAEETAAHVILECPGVATYRAQYLGAPGSLPEVVGNVRGLLGFLLELGGQE